VSTTVSQGLGITALGMALVFFTLGLVIVAIVLLTKLPWLRARSAKAEPPVAPLQTTTPAAAPPDEASVLSAEAETAPSPTSEEELGRIAAIAAAVLRSRRGARARPRQSTAARGGWKSYGRAHQLGL
jgi:Na+-transporting methylmalonyl-CoA/oxaloacetate decarboxylase gamma subunit